MAAIQKECSRIEQKFVIKVLMAEKGKPCEIFRRICGVYGEDSFHQKMFANGLNNESKKTIDGVETKWLSGKENVLTSTYNCWYAIKPNQINHIKSKKQFYPF